MRAGDNRLVLVLSSLRGGHTIIVVRGGRGEGPERSGAGGLAGWQAGWLAAVAGAALDEWGWECRTGPDRTGPDRTYLPDDERGLPSLPSSPASEARGVCCSSLRPDRAHRPPADRPDVGAGGHGLLRPWCWGWGSGCFSAS